MENKQVRESHIELIGSIIRILKSLDMPGFEIEQDDYFYVLVVQGIELIFGAEILAPSFNGLDVTSWLGMTAFEQVSEADGIGVLRKATPEEYSLFSLVGEHRDYWLGTHIPISINELLLNQLLHDFLEKVQSLRVNNLFAQC